MRATGITAVFLLATRLAHGGEGTCPACSRVWFQGTLQGVVGGTSAFKADLARGDLNSDAVPDVATADGATYVFVSYPDGYYRRGPVISSNDASAVAIADMNADGANDIVIGGASVRVALGNGTGAIAPPLPGTPAPAGASDLAVADFDGDGRPDVAACHSDADLVSVYRGTGGGQLAAPTSFPSGGFRPLALTAADFNRDGHPDLAVANNGGDLGSTLAVVLNDGTGQFHPALLQAVPTLAMLAIVSADLDGDGALDVALAGAGMPAVRIYRGDGTGGLAPAVLLPPAGGHTIAYTIAAGDFDGDGDLDLAFDQDSSEMHVYRRDGLGRYSGTTLLLDGNVRSMAAADVNRDGRMDLAISTSHGVVFLRPDIGQQVLSSSQIPTFVTPRIMFTDDFNNDGIGDLLVSDFNFTALYLGTGQFLQFALGPQTLPRYVWASADFNGDGNRDVVIPISGVYLGNGSGGFTLSAPGISGTVVADFNLDGKTDIAQASDVGPLPITTMISVYLGDGSGGFSPPVQTHINSSSSIGFGGIAGGRFNADNLPDLYLNSGTGTARLLLGNGSGGFAVQSLGSGFGVPVSGDFNGDGYSDVASAGVVRLGGATGLGAPTTYALPSVVGTHQVADVNGDGLSDVLVTHDMSTNPDLTVMFGDVSGQLHPVGLVAGAGPGVAAADWNGDGRVDLAVGSATALRVRLYAASTCDARTLALATPPSTCNAPGMPFATQPIVAAKDAADNVVCPAGTVTAALAPGTGTPGAVLGGATTVPLDAGIAAFANLAVDQPGRGYRLTFGSLNLVSVTSPTFSQGLDAAITGPSLVCTGQPTSFDAGYGYDSYAWLLNTAPVATTQTALLTMPVGSHALQVTVSQDACVASETLPVTSTTPTLSVSAAGATTVCAQCTGALLTAAVVSLPGSPVQWGYRTVTGGAITNLSGQTATIYRLNGADFPGPGTYFVVSTVSCGSLAVSNEIPVTVTSGPPVQEIAHGARILADLQELPVIGAARYRLLAQEPRSSYEIVVEATSGDIGAGQGPLLEHVAGDAQTVLASAAPVGAGPSRSLRIVNGGTAHLVEYVRLTSASCSSDCGPDDVYTLRAYETTLTGTRFNNSGTQTTVMIVHNTGSETVQGEVHFWSAAGAWLASQPFTLPPRQVFVLLTASVPALAGTGGALTVSHDGPYGSLAGKAVAVEPATGFSFDTPLTSRPR